MSFQCQKPGSWRGKPTRCWKCDHCLGLLGWLWRKRVVFEAELHPKVWFVTLTLKEGRTEMKYTDVSAWKKRVTSAARHRGARVRFFAAEEYGSLRGRKHWHCLLLLSKNLPRRALAGRWKGGFEDWREVNGDRPTKTHDERKGTVMGRYAAKMGRYVAKGGSFKGSNRFGYGEVKQYPHIDEIAGDKKISDLFPDARIVSVKRTSKSGAVRETTSVESPEAFKARRERENDAELCAIATELRAEMAKEGTWANPPQGSALPVSIREELELIADLPWSEGRGKRRDLVERCDT